MSKNPKIPKQEHKSEAEIKAQKLHEEKVHAEVERKSTVGKDIVKHFEDDNAQVTIIFFQSLQAAIKGSFEGWAMTKKVKDLDLISQINPQADIQKATQFKWALELLAEETIKGALDILMFSKNEIDMALMRMLNGEKVIDVLNYQPNDGQPQKETQ